MTADKKDPAAGQDNIDEIMAEIEQLQKGMQPQTAQVKPKPIPLKTSSAGLKVTQVEPVIAPAVASASEPFEEDAMKEFRIGASENDAPLEETFADLPNSKEEPSDAKTLFDEVIAQVDEQDLDAVSKQIVAEMENEIQKGDTMSTQNDSNDGTLSMTLTGNMTLKLKYEFEGQEVTIGFSDGALKVQLADGTEFKVPVRAQSALKRVA